MPGTVILNQPGVYLVDQNGNLITFSDGATISGTSEGLMVMGSDGSNARLISVDSLGRIGILDPPNLDVPSSSLATESTLSVISGTVAKESTLASVELKVATESTLSSIDTKVATESTLADINTNVSKETTLSGIAVTASTLSTEAKLEQVRSLLDSIDQKDFSTEVTLSGIGVTLLNGTQKTQISSPVDSIFSAVTVLDNTHSRLHLGRHYVSQNYQSVAGAGSSLDLMLSVPSNTYPHMLFRLKTDSAFSYNVYEGSTITVTGTQEYVFNNNRNSSNTSGITIQTNPTVSSVGLMLMRGQLSTGDKEGGAAEREDEIVLKPSTNYLIRVLKTDAGTGIVDYTFKWYEGGS